jgi:hypothetical protein
MKKIPQLIYLLYESLNEIKLDINNAAPVINNEFVVGDITYVIKYQTININGKNIPDISFDQKGNKTPNTKMRNTKPGEVFKIYSTMYKVTKEFLEKEKPEYFAISSFAVSGYFSIYGDLVKKNPIPGYFVANPMLQSKNEKGQILNTIILKRINKVV